VLQNNMLTELGGMASLPEVRHTDVVVDHRGRVAI